MTASHRTRMLNAVTELRYQLAQSKMAVLQAKERELRQTLANLTANGARPTSETASAPDAATIAGVQVQWQVWVNQRREALIAELALVLGQKADCRAGLVRAFGQCQAAKALNDKQRDQAKIWVARREAYES